MSLTLALTFNALADALLLGGLTYVMSRAAKLAPHGAQDTSPRIRPARAPRRDASRLPATASAAA